MPKRDNRLLLQDIYNSGIKINRYVKNFSFQTFQANELVVDAVIRNFEIIGEAARNLPFEFTQTHSNIPWREIVGYRNLLIHEYFGISLQTVWNIIQDDLPILMKNIESLLDFD